MQKRFGIVKLNASDGLYKLLLTIFILIRLLNSTYVRNVFNIDLDVWNKLINWSMPFLLLFLFLFEFKSSAIRMKELIVELIVLFILFVNFLMSRNATLIISILFMITYPRSSDIKSLAKYISKVLLVFTACILVGCMIGILPDIIVTGHSGSIRHSFGFVSHNAFSNIVAIGLLIYFYGQIEDWQLWNSISYIIIAILVYSFANSRMATLIILILSVSGPIYKKMKSWRVSKIFYIMTSWLFPIFFIVSYALVVYMSGHENSVLYNELNSALSGRIHYAIYYLYTYGLSFVGQKIETVGIYEANTQGVSWMGLDTSYLMIPIQFGILFLLLFIMGYYVLGKQLRKDFDLAGALVAVLFLVYGLTENCLFGIQYNFSMFLLANALLARRPIMQSQSCDNSGTSEASK